MRSKNWDSRSQICRKVTLDRNTVGHYKDHWDVYVTDSVMYLVKDDVSLTLK